MQFYLFLSSNLVLLLLLLINWVANFDTYNYIWDDWELFNPKGAIPPTDFDSFDYDNFNDESSLD